MISKDRAVEILEHKGISRRIINNLRKKLLKPLDMRKIKSKPSKIMSSKEALSDVEKIDWQLKGSDEK